MWLLKPANVKCHLTCITHCYGKVSFCVRRVQPVSSQELDP